ncbi:MAG: hypothetical protein GEU89_12250 [Kiloniellaceae bacterium]|nr:hypothetical protein [Kiloniellaceae bacterium]
MPSFKTVARGATTLAFVLAALTAPALAGQTSDHVYSIALNKDGISGFVTIQNVSANKHVNAVQIQPMQQNVSLSMSAWVSCEKPPYSYHSNLVEKTTKMYYGILGLGHGQVWVQNVLYEKQYKPSYAYWKQKGVSNFTEKETVSVNQPDFVVPLSAIKNGPAELRFDPVAIFNQKLQEHVNGGGDKVAFLQQDHLFSVERPISLGAHCYFHKSMNKNSVGGAWETVVVPLTVKYKGDPAINDTPVLSAQIAEGMPNQLQAGPSPLKITQMTFQPNMPHHIGACPATTKIRVNYMGQGKGEIRIVVRDNTLLIHNSAAIPFNASNGPQYYDFEIETLQPAAFYINKTVSHNLSLQVYAKDEKANVWPSAYQTVDNAVWNHRCTPQVNPVIGGAGGGGKVGGYQGNSGGGTSVSPTLQVKPAVVPLPTPGRVQAPTDGDPAVPVIRRAQ